MTTLCVVRATPIKEGSAMTDLTDSDDFTVTLGGEDWWRVLRVLTGEAPANRDLANSISSQLWAGVGNE